MSLSSAMQGTSEEHVVVVGDKNCNLLDASARYDWSLICVINPLDQVFQPNPLQFSHVFQTVNWLSQPITALPAARAN